METHILKYHISNTSCAENVVKCQGQAEGMGIEFCPYSALPKDIKSR